MRSLILLLSVFLLAASAKAQLVKDSLLIEDHYRTFSYTIPRAGAENFSLLFVLHGSGGSGKDMMKPAAALEVISGTEQVLMVYPDAYKHFWNECRKAATSEANKIDINEQAFFDGMIRYFHQKFKTADRYAFVVGLSGGGHMAYKLGLTMPDKFIAISAVVANLPDSSNMDCFAANVPIAVMISNGTKDPLNHYEGGEIIIGGTSWGRLVSADQTFAYWANLAGYSGKPVEIPIMDADTSNHQTITEYSYKSPGKPEVSFYKVIGGEHAFPKDMDVFLRSWDFFKNELKRKGAAVAKNPIH